MKAGRNSQTGVPQVSLLRPGFFRKALNAIVLTAALGSGFSAIGQTSDAPKEDQKLPWQIGSSALAGKQSNPVVFLSPEQTTLTANKPSVLELQFRIADGLHINSHKPHDATLIPTQILVADNEAFNTTAVDFPAGTDTAFTFAPNEKLNVYSGEFVLRAHLTAKPGHHLWQGVMRYQACDNSQCLPPRKVPVAVEILAK
jgi:hypothetical protein